MKNIIRKLSSLFTTEKSYKIQSFTYFIPAPKQFSQQYREKQFDKIFYDFINLGFEIIDIKTENCGRQEGSGMWFICIVRAKNDIANELNLEEEIENIHNLNAIETSNSHLKNDEFEIIPE